VYNALLYLVTWKFLAIVSNIFKSANGYASVLILVKLPRLIVDHRGANVLLCHCSVHIERVRLCLWTAVTNGPIVNPLWYMSMDSNSGIILTGETEQLGENPCPSETSHTTNLHIDSPGREFGTSRWEVGDEPPESYLVLLLLRQRLKNRLAFNIP
jgi:hypothetical protein